MVGVRRAVVAVLASLATAAPASAAVIPHAGTDPASNFHVEFSALPASCSSQPTGTECENAAVSQLNQSRASLGQPAYLLPTHFTTLTPAQQAFVLTNLDRTLYGLPVVPGLTDQLNNQAMTTGVQAENDPTPGSIPWTSYTTNYAWGQYNMPLAYQGWMYDDGYGSGNVDCPTPSSDGCWGHRHDILATTYFENRTLAMGAASGASTHHSRNFAMLIVGGTPGTYNPTYSYTWDQAVADGAGVAPATPPANPDPDPGGGGGGGQAGSVSITGLKVHGHTVKIEIEIPAGAAAECGLWRKHTPAKKQHYRSCDATPVYRHVKDGRYTFSVRTDSSSDSRKLKVG